MNGSARIDRQKVEGMSHRQHSRHAKLLTFRVEREIKSIIRWHIVAVGMNVNASETMFLHGVLELGNPFMAE